MPFFFAGYRAWMVNLNQNSSHLYQFNEELNIQELGRERQKLK